MKKLITVSILSAALAASSAFAAPGKNNGGGFNGGQGKDGQALSVFVPGKMLKNNDAKENISSILNAIAGQIDGEAEFKGISIDRDRKTHLLSGTLNYQGKVAKISSTDIASIAEAINKQAGGDIAASKGKLLVLGNMNSEDLNPVFAFTIKQTSSSITVEQVRADENKVQALASKLSSRKNLADLDLEQVSSDLDR